MKAGQKRQPPLTVTHPELVLEWHPSKNARDPSKTTQNCSRLVWWQCSKNKEHVWQRLVVSRAKGSRCPDCKLEEGNLGVLFPEIAKQWHPTLNGDVRPQDVTPGSENKYWWQCPLDAEHVYEATVYARTGAGSNCHFCNWTKIDSKRSLQGHNPEIAKEWHPTRNGDLRPNKVSYGSGHYAWWLCPKDATHEWQEVVYTRTGMHSPCPFCQGYYLTDKNRFSTCFPEIASEWHPTKNRKLWIETMGTWHEVRNRRVPPAERQKNRRLRPSDVSVNSHEYAWWLCKNKHSWQAVVADRIRYQTGCPYCTNQKVCFENSLEGKHPALAKMWHPSRNLPLLPSEVVPGSNKVVWWRCPKVAIHVWDAPVYRIVRSRKAGHRSCPFCVGKRLSPDNTLAAKCPTAAKLWHPTRNKLKPTDVAPKSNKVVWWLCPKRHEWKCPVYMIERAISNNHTGYGCPHCSGRAVSDENSLAVKHPSLAKLWWHPELNLPRRPSQLKYMSTIKAWWRCPKTSKHSPWEAPVRTVVKAHNNGKLCCPTCARQK